MNEFDDISYSNEDYEQEEWEEEYSCDNCGSWCPEWGGDGLCMLEIEEQSKMRKEYEENHTRKGKCPICGKELDEYDIYAGEAEPFTWSAGWYYPILGIEVLGPLWLNKGVIHGKDGIFHVWIEWGTGKQERLLHYLTKEEAEKVNVK